MENNLQFVKNKISEIQAIIKELKARYPHKEFTMDGRLVGDLGEIAAEVLYDLKLYEKLEKHYDGVTSTGQKVQIKATFKNSLTFKNCCDYYLGLKFEEDGTISEIFNGPGKIINQAYSHRKGFGKELLSFPIKALKELSSKVEEGQRIPKRFS
ncbi:hypothetical protein MYP_2791 [Sporocytophaga myxococcoides]|uniref:DUF6998 domain-containing protein n=1 Tax=Sporocytophaga myxococcoides TaxID=153721 RepID=A0A098LGJ6_9BACT|nr:hypothetical protein [Sporocytophaga myxococcoides]GAL85562.1 hypothetical protein MYP_2791 [Sporocytophaga myxococcoides]